MKEGCSRLQEITYFSYYNLFDGWKYRYKKIELVYRDVSLFYYQIHRLRAFQMIS